MTLAGVDVGSYQGPPAGWRAAAGQIGFGAVKFTELEPDGTRYVNPEAAADWQWLKAQGKGRIAYLFGHPSVSAGATAALFVTVCGQLGLDDGDGIALDLEVTDGLSSAAVAAWAQVVLGLLRKRLGRVPLLYTFLSFADAGNCAGLNSYPLWIADPSSPAGRPRVPSPWKTWAVHQYEIAGPIDRDIARWDTRAAMSAALGRIVPQPEGAPVTDLGGSLSGQGLASARWEEHGVIVVAGTGADGHLYAIRWDGKAWGTWSQVAAGPAKSGPSLVAAGKAGGRLYYTSADGHVHELVTADQGKTWT